LTAQKSSLIPLEDEDAWDDETDFPENLQEEVFIKHIDGPLFFGSTASFQQVTQAIPSTASVVILRMGKMDYIDQTGLYALEDLLIDLISKDIKVLFIKVQEQPKYMLERIDVIPDLIPEDQQFSSFKACLAWIKNNVEDIYPPEPPNYESLV